VKLTRSQTKKREMLPMVIRRLCVCL